MKKFIFSVFICCLFFHQQIFAQELKSEFLLDLNIDLNPPLPPSDYYFRTSVYFETSSPQYACLNHTVAIGVGRFPATHKVAYRIYAIK